MALRKDAGEDSQRETPDTETLKQWFVTNFRKHRNNRGMNYVQISSRSGVAVGKLRIWGSVGISRSSEPEDLKKVCDALGIVDADILWQNPNVIPLRSEEQMVDVYRRANPRVDDVLANQPELARQLTQEDVKQLYQLRGHGGPLTDEGVIHAAKSLLWRKEILRKCDTVLQSHLAESMASWIHLAYESLRIPPAPPTMG